MIWLQGYLILSLSLYLGLFVYGSIRYGVASGYWSWAFRQPLYWGSLLHGLAVVPIAMLAGLLSTIFRHLGQWVGAPFELLELGFDRAGKVALKGPFNAWVERAKRGPDAWVRR